MIQRNTGKAVFAVVVAILIVSVGALSYVYFDDAQQAYTGTTDDPSVPATGDEGEEPVVQNLAPDFTYPAVNGGTVSLSGLRGKVVILDFMATWCQPCKDQIENLKTIRGEYPGVEIISINVDLQVSNPELLQYRADRSASWDFVTDSDGVSMNPKYSVTSIPTILIVNKEGGIAKRNVGLMSVDALSTVIEPLL